MKITPQEQYNIFSVIAAILHLGNIQFLPSPDSAEVVDKKSLDIAAELLGFIFFLIKDFSQSKKKILV